MVEFLNLKSLIYPICIFPNVLNILSVFSLTAPEKAIKKGVSASLLDHSLLFHKYKFLINAGKVFIQSAFIFLKFFHAQNILTYQLLELKQQYCNLVQRLSVLRNSIQRRQSSGFARKSYWQCVGDTTCNRDCDCGNKANGFSFFQQHFIIIMKMIKIVKNDTLFQFTASSGMHAVLYSNVTVISLQ